MSLEDLEYREISINNLIRSLMDELREVEVRIEKVVDEEVKKLQ